MVAPPFPRFCAGRVESLARASYIAFQFRETTTCTPTGGLAVEPLRSLRGGSGRRSENCIGAHGPETGSVRHTHNHHETPPPARNAGRVGQPRVSVYLERI